MEYIKIPLDSIGSTFKIKDRAFVISCRVTSKDCKICKGEVDIRINGNKFKCMSCDHGVVYKYIFKPKKVTVTGIFILPLSYRGEQCFDETCDDCNFIDLQFQHFAVAYELNTYARLCREGFLFQNENQANKFIEEHMDRLNSGGDKYSRYQYVPFFKF